MATKTHTKKSRRVGVIATHYMRAIYITHVPTNGHQENIPI